MSETESIDQRRRLPAVSHLLNQPRLRNLVGLYGTDLLTAYVRQALGDLRSTMGTDGGSPESEETLLGELVDLVAGRLARRLDRRLTRILNATGIFLHTNLGRAPLPREIAANLPGLLNAYCDLELARDTGRRGDRNRRAARLLESLTGAEAALVLNNNAAALVVVLSTLARGREVIVSRGELVEIGGSFRIADILEASGARLVEVGSTNRTRLDDFSRALTSDTALLLKVHPSNYRISGFTESAPLEELVELAGEAGVPLLVDEGSGLLRPHRAPQLSAHSSLSELLAGGCDLVCGSADKLLGGPQAGLLLGTRELVERCHRNPIYRAMRPDRTCFVALEAVLRLHLAGEPLPIDRMWMDEASLRARLEAVVERCGGRIVAAQAYVGGGAAPEAPIAGFALAYPGEQRLLASLREGEPPVIAYVKDDHVIVDLRTIDPEDDSLLVETLRAALAGERPR